MDSRLASLWLKISVYKNSRWPKEHVVWIWTTAYWLWDRKDGFTQWMLFCTRRGQTSSSTSKKIYLVAVISRVQNRFSTSQPKLWPRKLEVGSWPHYGERFSDKLVKSSDNACLSCLDSVKSDGEEFNVLCHGDLCSTIWCSDTQIKLGKLLMSGENSSLRCHFGNLQLLTIFLKKVISTTPELRSFCMDETVVDYTLNTV